MTCIFYNLKAAQIACQKLKERMSTIASNMQGVKWPDLVSKTTMEVTYNFHPKYFEIN